MVSARRTSTVAIQSTVWVMTVDPQQAPYASSLRQLAVSAMCTNRDLRLCDAPGNFYSVPVIRSLRPPVDGLEEQRRQGMFMRPCVSCSDRVETRPDRSILLAFGTLLR